MGLTWQWRRIPAVAAAALCVALAAAGAAARAQAGAPADTTDAAGQSAAGSTRLDLDLADAQFTTAINLIRQRTGIQIVVIPGDQAYRTVTVSLKDQPVDEVLKLVARSAGADFWQQDGIYYFGPAGSAPKPDVAAPLPPEAPAPAPPPDWRVEKVHLQWITPAEVLTTLGIQRSSEPDGLDQLRLQGLQAVTGATPSPYAGTGSSGPIFLSPYGQAVQVNSGGNVAPAAPTGGYNAPQTGMGPGSQAGQPAAANNGLQGAGYTGAPAVGNAGSAPDQTAHFSSNPGQQEFGRGQGFPGGGFGQGGGGGFGQGPGGGGPGGFGGGGAGQGPGGAGGGGQANLTNLLPPGITPGDIVAMDADNTLLLHYTTPLQLEQFRNLIALIDVKPRQVLIRAQFVTALTNDVTSFGIDWNFTKVNLIAGANAGYSATNTAFVQYAIGNLQTQLSWILTTGRGKLLTSPMATTMNGIPARFVNATTIPVIIQTPVIGFNGTVVLSTTVVGIPVTVSLVVVPYINGDDSITLVGNVTNFAVLGSITDPAGGSFPIVGGQQGVITRIVPNGETMVISGLTSKQDNTSEDKIPLLGDLPLIGTLFRSRNTTTNDSELLVFITPEILPDRPGNGGSAAAPASGGTGSQLLP